MKIANVDLNKQVFIIAELSANHNQDINMAKKAIVEAKKAGADAIKFQTYTPDSMTLNIKKPYFKAGDIWSNEYLYDLYKRAYMPYEWYDELKCFADENEIIMFSSPFDKEAVDLLYNLDVEAYKIASFEITDIPLIKYCASKAKPIIISTGIADIEDIQLAVDTCKSVGNKDIILLKCTSAYPAKDEDMNLKTIKDLKERFGVEVGLSDHSLGFEAVYASVALGARVIEKHFTPDKSIDTPDKSFSLDPFELKEMVKGIRRIQKMLGEVKYTSKKDFARTLFVVKNIKKGERFSLENIKAIRPGLGLHPKYLDEIIGKKALVDINKGEPLKEEMIEI
jgi:pseudaminic acid synthase